MNLSHFGEILCMTPQGIMQMKTKVTVKCRDKVSIPLNCDLQIRL